VIQNSYNKILSGSKGTIIHKPIHHDHVGLRLICAYWIRMSFPPGLSDGFLLPFNSTGRLRLRRCIKLRKVFVHQLKALKDIVVTPEKDARVCGMVKLSMEFFEILEGKARDSLRVSCK
jgi:hypothetical protein